MYYMIKCITICIQKDCAVDYEDVQNVHFNIFLKYRMSH